MLLTKFQFVNHEVLQGLMYQGRLIAFEKITDQMAEELLSKTHVLKRLPSVATNSEVATLPENGELPSSDGEATSRGKRTPAKELGKEALVTSSLAYKTCQLGRTARFQP